MNTSHHNKFLSVTISFDLDDTLIPSSKTFLTERQNFLHFLFGIEKLRLGTIDLFTWLKKENYNICIYTTSYRSRLKIRTTFLLNGFWIKKIINQQRHNNEVDAAFKICSKHPPSFGIDVHIDDSEGLSLEGQRFNFRTIIVSEKDENWSRKIIEILSNLDVV